MKHPWFQDINWEETRITHEYIPGDLSYKDTFANSYSEQIDNDIQSDIESSTELNDCTSDPPMALRPFHSDTSLIDSQVKPRKPS